jgi:hypothetical protein
VARLARIADAKHVNLHVAGSARASARPLADGNIWRARRVLSGHNRFGSWQVGVEIAAIVCVVAGVPTTARVAIAVRLAILLLLLSRAELRLLLLVVRSSSHLTSCRRTTLVRLLRRRLLRK